MLSFTGVSEKCVNKIKKKKKGVGYMIPVQKQIMWAHIL